jgi:hypothetical protein
VEEPRSDEFEEIKKVWSCCAFRIMVSGAMMQRFKQQTTGLIDLGEARRFITAGKPCSVKSRDSLPHQLLLQWA